MDDLISHVLGSLPLSLLNVLQESTVGKKNKQKRILKDPNGSGPLGSSRSCDAVVFYDDVPSGRLNVIGGQTSEGARISQGLLNRNDTERFAKKKKSVKVWENRCPRLFQLFNEAHEEHNRKEPLENVSTSRRLCHEGY